LDTTRSFEPSLGGSHDDMKIVDQFSWKSWDRHMKVRIRSIIYLRVIWTFYMAKGLPHL